MSRERVESVVEAFIASYRRAFERGDPEAILGHFGKSVHLVSDTGTDVRAELLTRAEWRRTVEQLVSRYRTLGVGRIELRALDTTGLSERLVQTRVTWALLDRRGDALYEFSALYTLTCDGTSCLVVAVAHDELVRSRRDLIQRPSPGDATSSPNAG
jgi:hypothetical protein